jgi:hypothetical protein
MYCGSADHGKGCRFGPHGVHFHPDDSTKCGFCGSTSYGRGCRLNPTSDLHVHGSSFNSMYKESVQSFLDNEILLKELKKDFRQFQCYKLGIIDKDGNKVKNPITEQEKLSFTPFVKTVLKLKKYLGSKLDLLEAQNDLSLSSLQLNENIEHYKKVLDYQDKVKTIVNELYKTLDEATEEGLCLEDIQKLLKA